MKNKIASAFFSAFALVSAIILAMGFAGLINPLAAEASTVPGTSFSYTWNSANSILNEGGSMSESSSPYWWVNSGGEMITNNGLGMTIQGDLPATNIWRQEYAITDPENTDNGLHPQNIFRFVTRSLWQNEDQRLYFKITRYHLSNATERYNPNGVLLFNRYVDSDNLYYAGIRVDGDMVIKKKINGAYYTMAEKKLFPGIYNHDTNPILIPQNVWMSERTRVVTNPDGTVSITLYVDPTNSGIWTATLTAKDDGKSYGGRAITSAGYAGIRTDFMDVFFNDYRITAL